VVVIDNDSPTPTPPPPLTNVVEGGSRIGQQAKPSQGKANQGKPSQAKKDESLQQRRGADRRADPRVIVAVHGGGGGGEREPRGGLPPHLRRVLRRIVPRRPVPRLQPSGIDVGDADVRGGIVQRQILEEHLAQRPVDVHRRTSLGGGGIVVREFVRCGRVRLRGELVESGLARCPVRPC